jgi:hypothetical protein
MMRGFCCKSPRTSGLEASTGYKASTFLPGPGAGVLPTTLLVAVEGTAALGPEGIVTSLARLELLAYSLMIDPCGEAARCS